MADGGGTTTASSDTIVVDGSQAQGGGQSLRVALFLSTLLQRPLEFINIRYDRPKPGLRPQHLHGLRTVGRITQAELEGDQESSTAIRFSPDTPRPGQYTSDPGTAGSITLTLQTLLPLALVTPGRLELTLRGGTDVTHSPTWDWFSEVYLDWARPLFERLDVEVVRRGFYPKGGGEVRVTTETAFDAAPGRDELHAHLMERRGEDRTDAGTWDRISGISIAHEDLADNEVAERQAQAARQALVDAGHPAPRISTRYVSSPSKGTAIALWAEDDDGHRVGGDSLGAPGRPAETVGKDAADGLTGDLATGATVDRYMADHLVPWAALGAGAVRIPRITDHVRDALRLTRRFIGEDAVRLDEHVLAPGPRRRT